MRPGHRTLVALAISFCAISLSAATVSKLNDDTFAQLREPAGRRKLTVNVALDDRRVSPIELEQFEVWSPGAKIAIHSDSGIEYVDPPARRFYRGPVKGEPESFAFFSVDETTGTVDGLVAVRERKFSVASVKRGVRNGPRKFDDFLTAAGPEDEIPQGEELAWQCQVDKVKPLPSDESVLHATGADGLPVIANGITGTQKYAITVEVETDFELYQIAGSNATTLTNYVANLTGAVSTIYNRDISTNVTLGSGSGIGGVAVDIYTTNASDPWTTADPATGLNQLADTYHTATKPAGRTTSAVVMLSGQPTAAGIAYTNIICGPDGGAITPPGNHFFGPYGWCGGIGSIFGGTSRIGSIPNVTLPAFMPPAVSGGSDVQDFWPLEEYAHELGHILAGRHTHCIALTAGEAAATGRSFVDTCTNVEAASGCFSSAPGITCNAFNACSPAVPEKGTIMSYCHNVYSGLTPQSRFTLGIVGVPTDMSHHEIDDQMFRAAGPAQGGSPNRNIINGVGAFTISTFTAPASVGPGSTGNVASATASAAATFRWTIGNGSITAGQGTSSITFTAGASGTVTVGVSAYSTANLCGVSDTKAVAIVAGFSPPTSVVATFNNVNTVTITWTAPAVGTTPVQYDIYRSAANNFASFGAAIATPLATSGTTFNDSTVSLGSSYVYKIRSAGAGGASESGDSNRDIATAVVVTAPSLTSNVSMIRAADMNEIHAMANAIHRLAGLGDATLTNLTVTAGTSKINAVDLTQARTAINQALPAMGFSAFTFTTDPTITGNTTTVKRQHITEARTAVQ